MGPAPQICLRSKGDRVSSIDLVLIRIERPRFIFERAAAFRPHAVSPTSYPTPISQIYLIQAINAAAGARYLHSRLMRMPRSSTVLSSCSVNLLSTTSLPRRLCRHVRPDDGDRLRLADTELIIEVEKDFTIYGDEVKFGGGKVIRDGMGQSAGHQQAGRRRFASSPTRSIARSLGHRQSRCRLKDGRIAAIGKAGNPDIQPGVTIIVGPGTEVIAGEGKILTAGGFDIAHPFHLPAADRRSARCPA